VCTLPPPPPCAQLVLQRSTRGEDWSPSEVDISNVMQLYMLTTQMDGAKRAAMWLAVGFGAAAAIGAAVSFLRPGAL